MQQNGKPEKTITKQATIQGHVRNDQNAGVPNVSVSYGDNGDIATHSTNSSGFYKFTGVDAEIGNTEYQVKIKTIPNGYRCTTAALVNVKVYPGAVKTVDFALAPATASNQNSSSGPPPSSPPLRFADQRQLRGFRFDGRQIIEVKCDPTGTVAEQLLTPPYTSADRMMFLDEPVVFADEQTEDPNQLLAQFGNSKLAILNKTPGRFRLLTPHQEAQFEFFSQFFFQDGQRSYYVVPAVFFDLASYWKAVFQGLGGAQIDPTRFVRLTYLFQTFFHPHVQALVAALNKGGVGGILARSMQTIGIQESFADRYEPDLGPSQSLVLPFGYPNEGVQFEPYGAYSLYNWELFFHAPFLIATHLSKNQRFAEAQRWFHYIFDPTDNSNDPNEPGRFWRTYPFYLAGQVKPIDELLKILADKTNASQEKQQLEAQVAQWRRRPFKPHAIAGWRPGAYQKAVIMKYLDNLIAWGDQLFRRDTIEAINEATQLYVLADQILGPRPERIQPRTKPKVHTYKTLEPDLDAFANALVQAENAIPTSPQSHPPASNGSPPLPMPTTLYFCVPHNEKLLDYWDTVADRLFKIRHCMNIEGVVRQLPLFEPPIDPALLVRAAAAGIDIASVLSDLNAPLPIYRFDIMAQKASELCAEVKSLGAALLAALEKRDAETLALLRSQHEISLLEAVRQVKTQAVEEAKASIIALTASLDMARTRLRYYCTLLSSVQTITLPPPTQQSLDARLSAAAQQLAVDTAAPGVDQAIAAINAQAEELMRQARQSIASVAKTVEDLKLEALKLVHETLSRLSQEPTESERLTLPISGFEKKQLDELQFANEKQKKAMNYELLAQVLSLIPDLNFGAQGWASSPVVHLSFGGTQLSKFVGLQANQYHFEASDHTYQANLNSLLGGYQRRTADWQHQVDLALKESEQIGQQIQAACIRLEIATQDLANQDRQIKQARDVDATMREKYTNQELYNWMVGQISDVYFRSYQLAYDVAKRAERAFRFELGLSDSNFLQFGYWDSLKKGLLAGERLSQDLKRMEVAYLEQNRREYEITKHISLLQLDPVALLQLRESGECYISVPEALFDLDFPGHYLRRIKLVSISIPCVTGPYIGVHCTLTLVKNSVRHGAATGNRPYPRDEQNQDDPRFTDSYGAIQSIVTSSGQNDSGLFEPNLRDERYLPFEGAGAISTWRVELPTEFRQFNYDTIADVILHMRYTARDGGSLLKQQAVLELQGALNNFMRVAGRQGLVRALSLRQEFPSVFHRLATSPVNTEIDFTIESRHFPFFLMGRTLKLGQLNLRVLSKLGSLEGTTLAIGEREDTTLPPKVRNMKAPSSPTSPNPGGTLRSFEFVDVVTNPPYLGVASTIVGDYMIKLTTAGPLASDPPGNGTGPIDATDLHDIILEIGYSLA